MASKAAPSLLRRIWHNVPAVAVLVLSLAIVVGLAVIPARTWLQQQELTAETQNELDRIQAGNAELEAQLARLQTDEEVERIGREHFDLVFPGEESYRILPPPDR